MRCCGLFSCLHLVPPAWGPAGKRRGPPSVGMPLLADAPTRLKRYARLPCRCAAAALSGLRRCGGSAGALAVRLPGLVLPRRGRSRCPAAAAPPVARPARRSGRPAPHRVAGGRCGPAPCRPSRRLRRAAAGRGRPAVAVSSRRPFGAAGHPPPGGPPLAARRGVGGGPTCRPAACSPGAAFRRRLGAALRPRPSLLRAPGRGGAGAAVKCPPGAPSPRCCGALRRGGCRCGGKRESRPCGRLSGKAEN